MSSGREPNSIKALLLRLMSGEELNAAEQARLQQWKEASPDNEELLNQVMDDDWLVKEVAAIQRVDTEKYSRSVAEKLHPDTTPVETPVRRMRNWKTARITAAAAVLLILAGLGLSKEWPRTAKLTDNTSASLFNPEGLAAAGAAAQIRLTLEDGSVISLLNNNIPQQLPEQAGVQVRMEDGRRLVYSRTGEAGMTTGNKESNTKDAKQRYNTLTIPRGQQFELVLTDGSRVWLNNASSLRYPVSFTGSDRVLQLTGEAYFEVAQAAGRPFRVQTPSIETDVLGTHFNIRDYPNEQTPRTTLLQGKVVVRKGPKEALLNTPGDEARALKGAAALQVTPVNPGSRVSWISGDFYFDSLDIRASLREVARWYRMDLRFEGGAEKAKLAGGETTRDQPLVKLLRHLERTDLHFQVKDSIIIVSR